MSSQRWNLNKVEAVKFIHTKFCVALQEEHLHRNGLNTDILHMPRDLTSDRSDCRQPKSGLFEVSNPRTKKY